VTTPRSDDDSSNAADRDAALAGPLVAVALLALSACLRPSEIPTIVAPYLVDVRAAPWYHFAASEGVGETTARRWTDVRDLLASEGLNPPFSTWPRAGPKAALRFETASRRALSDPDLDDP
jgi:hypothetical protein